MNVSVPALHLPLSSNWLSCGCYTSNWKWSCRDHADLGACDCKTEWFQSKWQCWHINDIGNKPIQVIGVNGDVLWTFERSMRVKEIKQAVLDICSEDAAGTLQYTLMADNDILADEERPWDSFKLEGANYKNGCLLLGRSLVEPPPVEPSPAKGKGKSKYKKGSKACDTCGERPWSCGPEGIWTPRCRCGYC